MSRRSTPQVAHKLGRNPRDREREIQDEYWLEDERESFPQFCMTCEKQFVPQDEKFLYCSEGCRARDQHNAPASSMTPRSHGHSDRSSLYYPFYAAGDPEPRDIIPRASPSRPHSMQLSPPTSPNSSSQHTSAMSALKSLTMREPSPPSPPASYHTTVWPWSSRSTATSPSTSYTLPTSMYDSYGYTMTPASTTERPLPSRRPGGYSRPKSIELVTPVVNSR
ncbi:hypothetical protein VSDG_09032 [Cytospora chrysosperma]|uniref:Uncharacterized protein n=1 Tax=Cytospora chrysosperma TaxID=252740 RepID=A0A423VBJ3_CYTCH|nr:hypothetical protein VSDG_09032 [Valsa sordida]